MSKVYEVLPKNTGKTDKGDFTFPTNVKQIGGVSDRLKLYVEDYAYTYLTKLKEEANEEEILGFLVGRQAEADGEEILLISGIIQGKFCKVMDGAICFTDDDWKHAEIQINKYFQDLYIVGWLHIQPGYGSYISSVDQSYHTMCFSKKNNVLLLCDPMEKSDCFFTWAKTGKELVDLSGYFIYFDKNLGMGEYMSDSSPVEIFGVDDDDDGMYRYEESRTSPTGEEDPFATEDEYERQREEILDNYKKTQTLRRSSEIYHQRKIINMLISVCAVFFLVCIVMGVGLIQNGERIAEVEERLASISRSYEAVLAQINNGAYPAFAGSVEPSDMIGAQEDTIPFIIPESEGVSYPEDSLSPTENPIYSAIANSQQNAQQDTGDESSHSDDVAFLDESATIPETYVVEAGDTLSQISVKFYGTREMTAKIMEANGITDAHKLTVGKVITLPQP